ncbi:unnamed protein product [Schistosoma margrebowiei]|uniref:Uncharacterized protein n=1 Tax=Schistosoma margrebowiei TaxID=48269 RepID=A0A183LK14_9TREM|nr:unnamed protein product [Schistosoma margrebowiei]
MYDCVYKSLYESLKSTNIKEAVAVIDDTLSCPETSISETCPIAGSNSLVPETQCTNTDLSSSQKDDIVVNAHEVVAVLAHDETGNESNSIMKTGASDGAHHCMTKISDEPTYRGSVVVLPDMSYLNDLHVLDQFFYKNEKNKSDVSNDDQEPNGILIDAEYPSDSPSTNEIFKKFDENILEELNFNDLISSAVDPHHLASSSELFIQ